MKKDRASGLYSQDRKLFFQHLKLSNTSATVRRRRLVFFAGQSTRQKSDFFLFCFHTHFKNQNLSYLKAFSHTIGLLWVKKGLTGQRTNGYWWSTGHVWLLEAFLALLNTNHHTKDSEFVVAGWIEKEIITLWQHQKIN